MRKVQARLKKCGMPSRWIDDIVAKGEFNVYEDTALNGLTYDALYHRTAGYLDLASRFFAPRPGGPLMPGTTSDRKGLDPDTLSAEDFGIVVHELFHYWYDKCIWFYRWWMDSMFSDGPNEEDIGHFIQEVTALADAGGLNKDTYEAKVSIVTNTDNLVTLQKLWGDFTTAVPGGTVVVPPPRAPVQIPTGPVRPRPAQQAGPSASPSPPPAGQSTHGVRLIGPNLRHPGRTLPPAKWIYGGRYISMATWAVVVAVLAVVLGGTIFGFARLRPSTSSTPAAGHVTSSTGPGGSTAQCPPGLPAEDFYAVRLPGTTGTVHITKDCGIWQVVANHCRIDVPSDPQRSGHLPYLFVEVVGFTAGASQYDVYFKMAVNNPPFVGPLGFSPVYAQVILVGLAKDGPPTTWGGDQGIGSGTITFNSNGGGKFDVVIPDNTRHSGTVHVYGTWTAESPCSV